MMIIVIGKMCVRDIYINIKQKNNKKTTHIHMYFAATKFKKKW
jgi:hypothetical protein